MDDIYREYILDLYRNPLNKKVLDNPTHKLHGHNANCGDDIWLYLNTKDDIVNDITFDGVGCALCIAGASITTDKLKGMPLQELSQISVEQIYQWLGIEMEATRIKCVTLALRTAQEMLK
ncbi:MAG: iron-sulfur cluster assembly scaffold protein [Candidatus Paceibacterota bacterium]